MVQPALQHVESLVTGNREGALFTLTMAMAAILRGNLYHHAYGQLPLKMAAIAMLIVNNAPSL